METNLHTHLGKIKTQKTPLVGKDAKQIELVTFSSWRAKWCHLFAEGFDGFFEVRMRLPTDNSGVD